MDLAATVIADVRQKLVDGFPPQVLACLQALSEEQLWWRPNEASNAVANLVLHVCGSSRHFVGRGVGGSGYVRDRPAEFAARGGFDRAALRALVEETAAETAAVLDRLRPDELTAVSERVGKPYVVHALLTRTTHHWAVHAGQMVWVTKLLREGALQELWMKHMPR